MSLKTMKSIHLMQAIVLQAEVKTDEITGRKHGKHDNDADNNDDVDTSDNKKESANKRVFNIVNNETDDEEYSSTTEILEIVPTGKSFM